MHWCAKEGHTKLVETLLQRGARVNATNMGDDIPLHLAAAHGHRDVVQMVKTECFFVFLLKPQLYRVVFIFKAA